MASRDSQANLFTSHSQEDMFEEEEDEKPKERIPPKPSKPTSKPASLKPFLNSVVPAIAVPEKILLVLDNTADESENYFRKDPELDTETSVSPESVHKEALKQFVCLKLSQVASEGTEIAVVTLEPNKILWQGLSSNKQRLMKELSSIGPQVSTNGEKVNITSIFNLVSNLVQLPEQPEKNVPPEYIVRIILMYCNSYYSPIINTEDSLYSKFSKFPGCVFDVLYLHEKPSSVNNVEQIFQQLSEFVSPRSYLLESSRNITNVYNQIMKLLAHPNQRVPQYMWNF